MLCILYGLGIGEENPKTNAIFKAKTPNYDTMMQMARWCGYREDYIDLTRIDTTADIIQYFRNLLDVEEQVRTKIHLDFLNGKTKVISSQFK